MVVPELPVARRLDSETQRLDSETHQVLYGSFDGMFPLHLGQLGGLSRDTDDDIVGAKRSRFGKGLVSLLLPVALELNTDGGSV